MPRSGSNEIAGYTISPMVKSFYSTPTGPVPQVASNLSFGDKLGTFRARIGALRSSYRIAPGIYCIGSPNASSPVLVTGNYKLSFDTLRKELSEIDCWILVIDSRGINVWCAAGKGTFSTEEISYQINKCNLDQIVNHRKIILPQLGATGVAAHELKSLCGFTGVFGPIRADDIPHFLAKGQISSEMRNITFTLLERLSLIPVEICLFWKSLLIIFAITFILSGLSPNFFSLNSAIERTIFGSFFTLIGIVTGAALTPLLLPWTFFRQFWLKGALLGVLTSLATLSILSGKNLAENLAIIFWITSLSSFLAMNFTGSTPFTSLTGVAKEMRRGLPFQIVSATIACILWVMSSFL